MSRYGAFLRGMNLGGRRLANVALRAHFEALGFADVATFRASGNVVFTAGDEPREQLQARVEEGLAAALGYAVPTFLRSARELRAIAAAEPFDAELLAASRGKLQVVMMAAAPPASRRREILELASEEDRLVLAGRELFWLPIGGVLESGIADRTLARLLGATTVRTKNTVEQLVGKYLAGSPTGDHAASPKRTAEPGK